MPGIIQTSPSFKTISIKELHPTFGAEVEGVDWQNMTDEQFDEIVEAMAKVRVLNYFFYSSADLLSTLVWRLCFQKDKLNR